MLKRQMGYVIAVPKHPIIIIETKCLLLGTFDGPGIREAPHYV